MPGGESILKIPVFIWYTLQEPEPGHIIPTYNHWETCMGDPLTPTPVTEAQEKMWRGRRWKRVDGFIDETGKVL